MKRNLAGVGGVWRTRATCGGVGGGDASETGSVTEEGKQI